MKRMNLKCKKSNCYDVVKLSIFAVKTKLLLKSFELQKITFEFFYLKQNEILVLYFDNISFLFTSNNQYYVLYLSKRTVATFLWLIINVDYVSSIFSESELWHIIMVFKWWRYELQDWTIHWDQSLRSRELSTTSFSPRHRMSEFRLFRNPVGVSILF